MTVLAWHRRHAVSLAAQLPDEPDDARIILELATQILNEFLDQNDAPPKSAAVIKLIETTKGGG